MDEDGGSALYANYQLKALPEGYHIHATTQELVLFSNEAVVLLFGLSQNYSMYAESHIFDPNNKDSISAKAANAAQKVVNWDAQESDRARAKSYWYCPLIWKAMHIAFPQDKTYDQMAKFADDEIDWETNTTNPHMNNRLKHVAACAKILGNLILDNGVTWADFARTAIFRQPSYKFAREETTVGNNQRIDYITEVFEEFVQPVTMIQLFTAFGIGDVPQYVEQVLSHGAFTEYSRLNKVPEIETISVTRDVLFRAVQQWRSVAPDEFRENFTAGQITNSLLSQARGQIPWGRAAVEIRDTQSYDFVSILDTHVRLAQLLAKARQYCVNSSGMRAIGDDAEETIMHKAYRHFHDNYNPEKKTHFAWWLFPTSRAGKSEHQMEPFQARTYIKDKREQDQLFRSANSREARSNGNIWIDFLNELARPEVQLTNEKGWVDDDIGRIAYFCVEWKLYKDKLPLRQLYLKIKGRLEDSPIKREAYNLYEMSSPGKGDEDDEIEMYDETKNQTFDVTLKVKAAEDGDAPEIWKRKRFFAKIKVRDLMKQIYEDAKNEGKGDVAAVIYIKPNEDTGITLRRYRNQPLHQVLTKQTKHGVSVMNWEPEIYVHFSSIPGAAAESDSDAAGADAGAEERKGEPGDGGAGARAGARAGTGITKMLLKCRHHAAPISAQLAYCGSDADLLADAIEHLFSWDWYNGPFVAKEHWYVGNGEWRTIGRTDNRVEVRRSSFNVSHVLENKMSVIPFPGDHREGGWARGYHIDYQEQGGDVFLMNHSEGSWFILKPEQADALEQMTGAKFERGKREASRLEGVSVTMIHGAIVKYACSKNNPRIVRDACLAFIQVLRSVLSKAGSRNDAVKASPVKRGARKLLRRARVPVKWDGARVEWLGRYIDHVLSCCAMSHIALRSGTLDHFPGDVIRLTEQYNYAGHMFKPGTVLVTRHKIESGKPFQAMVIDSPDPRNIRAQFEVTKVRSSGGTAVQYGWLGWPGLRDYDKITDEIRESIGEPRHKQKTKVVYQPFEATDAKLYPRLQQFFLGLSLETTAEATNATLTVSREGTAQVPLRLSDKGLLHAKLYQRNMPTDPQFKIHHGYVSRADIDAIVNQHDDDDLIRWARGAAAETPPLAPSAPLRFLLTDGTRFRPLEVKSESTACTFESGSVKVEYNGDTAGGIEVQVPSNYTGLEPQGFTPRLADVLSRAQELDAAAPLAEHDMRGGGGRVRGRVHARGRAFYPSGRPKRTRRKGKGKD